MNRFRIKYGPGSSYNDLPTEIVADSYGRIGAYTNFYRENAEGLSTILHSIANKAIVHIELTDEDIDE